jgi:mRNA interferase MazF
MTSATSSGAISVHEPGSQQEATGSRSLQPGLQRIETRHRRHGCDQPATASALLGEVWLQDRQAARLFKPSAVKPVLATLEQVMVIRQLGHLSARDRTLLKNAIQQIIG